MARASPSTRSRIGSDVYIESSGKPESVLQGLDMLRKQGRFVEFSVFDGATTVTATSSLYSVYLDRQGAQRS